ncbi:MAG: DMT family transporter [Glaciecola sp.]|nr:DMT family transporter [Glaciecola sp.]
MAQPRPIYGFILAAITAVLWGVLPLFLKICLEMMDSMTITAYRFLVAGVFIFGVLISQRQLPDPRQLSKPTLVLVLFASVMLVLNYTTNVIGLDYLNPETVQVIMQLAPFLLMLGGVLIFKERFTRFQTFGAGILLIGMLLFFNERLETLSHSTTESPIGLFIIIFAATTWAIYALAQKSLFAFLNAKQLTLFMYTLGFLLLVPLTDFGALLTLTPVHIGALLFCCLNTIIAYGAFTEAMEVWSASKVSAVIATAPIFTYLSMVVAIQIDPTRFVHSNMDEWAYVGACLVISGSIICSLGKKQPKIN